MPERAPSPQRGRRLQRPRTKGYRTPEGVRYAGRPSLLGNPFEWRRYRGRRVFGQAQSFKLHRRWAFGRLGALELGRLGFSAAEIDALVRRRTQLLRMLPDLEECDLQCWCPLTSRWCHVDTLLELIGLLRRA